MKFRNFWNTPVIVPFPTEEKRVILCNKHNKTIVITGGWLTQNIIWNFQKRRLPSSSNSFKFKSFVCAAKMPCVFYRFVSKTTRIFWRDYIIIRTAARGEKNIQKGFYYTTVTVPGNSRPSTTPGNTTRLLALYTSDYELTLEVHIFRSTRF